MCDNDDDEDEEISRKDSTGILACREVIGQRYAREAPSLDSPVRTPKLLGSWASFRGPRGA